MEGLRLLQRQTIQQLFQPRPILQQTLRQIHNSAHPAFRTIPLRQNAVPTRFLHTQRLPSKRRPITLRSRNPTNRRFNSTSSTAASDANLTLSQKMKKLSREYGWSAVGVYLLLTALDFPFCFAAVKWLGTDRIGHWEHVAMSYIKTLIKWPWVDPEREGIEHATQDVGEKVKDNISGENEKRILEEDNSYFSGDHGYKEAEEANSGDNASLWTQLVLAYAIHKSFIFIRVPLTVAVTPKVVKTLRSWGWNIGKRPVRKSAAKIDKTGVNTKGTGVKPDN